MNIRGLDLGAGEDSFPEEVTFKAENLKNEEKLRGKRLWGLRNLEEMNHDTRKALGTVSLYILWIRWQMVFQMSGKAGRVILGCSIE